MRMLKNSIIAVLAIVAVLAAGCATKAAPPHKVIFYDCDNTTVKVIEGSDTVEWTFQGNVILLKYYMSTTLSSQSLKGKGNRMGFYQAAHYRANDHSNIIFTVSLIGASFMFNEQKVMCAVIEKTQ